MPGRTLYFHMNSTNPVLDARRRRRRGASAGIEIASDGMELET